MIYDSFHIPSYGRSPGLEHPESDGSNMTLPQQFANMEAVLGRKVKRLLLHLFENILLSQFRRFLTTKFAQTSWILMKQMLGVPFDLAWQRMTLGAR